jgi:hypothetical protein
MATYRDIQQQQQDGQIADQAFTAQQAMEQQNAKMQQIQQAQMAQLQQAGIRPNTNGAPGQMAPDGLGNPQAQMVPQQSQVQQPMQLDPRQVQALAGAMVQGQVSQEQLASMPAELVNAAAGLAREAMAQQQPQGLGEAPMMPQQGMMI